MKKINVVGAAACAVMAIALPHWNHQLHAEDYSYSAAQFVVSNAQLQETLKYAGCKTVKKKEAANVVMYEDGQLVITRNALQITGEWAFINETFHFSYDAAGRSALLGYKNSRLPELNQIGLYEVDGLASCKDKHPVTTMQQIVAPSVPITKNQAKVSRKDLRFTQITQMKGWHEADFKFNKKTGSDFSGAFSAKTVISGVITECSHDNNYCDLPAPR